MKLIVGNFGGGNWGDELILSFALEVYSVKNDLLVMTVDPVLSQTFCEKEFQTIPFPPSGIKSLLIFVFDKKYRSEFEEHKLTVDEIIFPGGGLFAIRLWAVIVWAMNIWFLKKLYPNAKIKMHHQGVDKNMSGLGKKLTKWSFAQASEISARDQASLEALEGLSVSQVKLDEDIVLKSLKNFKHHEVKKNKTVLLNALSEIDDDCLKKLKTKFIDCEILYLPMQPSDKEFRPEAVKLVEPKTRTELFNLFQQAQFGVGERLHFLIPGQKFIGSKNCFSLKKPYSEKVVSFCAKFGIKFF